MYLIKKTILNKIWCEKTTGLPLPASTHILNSEVHFPSLLLMEDSFSQSGIPS